MTPRNAIAAATIIAASFHAQQTTAGDARVVEDPLAEMVVTATRIEREAFETPRAVTVLDEQAIQDANVSSSPDLFRHAEGVYVQKTNQGGGSPFISGLTGKQVLILIDGVRLNNSYFRYGPHQYLNTIDPGVIERIEVVRGPGSVLYGSDALGGTINIITRRRTDFAQDRDLDGSLHAYTQSASDSTALRLQIEGNADDFGMSGGVRTVEHGDLDGGGNVGDQAPGGYDERSADLKFNWSVAQNHELILGAQYLRQKDVPKTSEVTLGDKLVFDYEPQERLLSWLELRSADVGPFDAMTLNVSHQLQREGERIIARATPNTGTRELTEVRTLGASVQLHSDLGDRQRLTYGLETYHDVYDASKLSIDLHTGVQTQQVAGTPDGASYDSFGLYVQDEIRLSPRSDLIAGVRYSRFESEGRVAATTLSFGTDDVTASLNGLYRLTPNINLFAGVARGFRAPNMEDFFGRVDFVSEVPNTTLKPEKSLTREIGLKFHTERLSADLFYFDTDYEGFIDRVTIAPGVRQRQNLADSRIRGIEGALRYQSGEDWMLWTNFAWARGEDERTGVPLRRIPPWNGSVRLRHSPTESMWWEVATLLADRQDRLAPGDLTDPRIPAGGTPGYAVVDLAVGLRPFERHELLITVENIGDRKYKTHGSGVYSPGLSLNVGYRLSFD